MLRKTSSFVDPSVAMIGDDHTPYENACDLRDRFIRLVQDISVVPAMFQFGDEEKDARVLESRLSACFDGMRASIPSGPQAQALETAARRVYRLEAVLRYLWNPEPIRDVKYRQMCLDINFFEKEVRRPFFKIEFVSCMPSNFFSSVHWGEPEPVTQT